MNLGGPPAPSQAVVRPGLAAIAVGAGGAVGSLARAGIAAGIPHEPGTWAWSTFIVNATGCFALAALLVCLPTHWSYARLLLGTGVLGGYTTFSALSIDAVTLLDRGRPATAGAYVVLSVAVVLVAALAGRRAALVVTHRDGPRGTGTRCRRTGPGGS